MPESRAGTRRPAGRFARFRRDERGATAIEFGMISLPFFAILFAIAETGIAFLNGQFLDRAVEKASRKIFTGQLVNGQANPQARFQQFQQEICATVNAFFSCGNLMYDVQAYRTFGDTMLPIPMVNGDLDASALPRFNPGRSGEVVIVRVYYRVPVYADLLGAGMGNLAGNKRLLVGTAAFKNEPY
ncbi:MAG TPA: pilus assembly protein [Beijerinckiaceae bacterium]|nr:pilus assembly protein [Beijerinckiaceae bacterium]